MKITEKKCSRKEIRAVNRDYCGVLEGQAGKSSGKNDAVL